MFILVVALFTFFMPDQESMQVFPASIHHECAPWDGAAFTVQIPVDDDGTVIDTPIREAPDIKIPPQSGDLPIYLCIS